jgi:hypothetical protein
MTMHRALLLLSVVTACKSEDSRPTKAQDLPTLTAATQQDLVRELDQAEGRGTWGEVKRRWQGQTLTWKVTRHAALCRSADACYVAAFPIQRPAKRGWLPQLVFAPGQFAMLEQACADQARCEITVEGRLDKLEVSGEMPTNLRFQDVKLLTRTAAR